MLDEILHTMSICPSLVMLIPITGSRFLLHFSILCFCFFHPLQIIKDHVLHQNFPLDLVFIDVSCLIQSLLKWLYCVHVSVFIKYFGKCSTTEIISPLLCCLHILCPFKELLSYLQSTKDISLHFLLKVPYLF